MLKQFKKPSPSRCKDIISLTVILFMPGVLFGHAFIELSKDLIEVNGLLPVIISYLFIIFFLIALWLFLSPSKDQDYD